MTKSRHHPSRPDQTREGRGSRRGSVGLSPPPPPSSLLLPPSMDPIVHSHAIKYFSILFLFADLSHLNFRPILQISTVSSSSSPRRGLSSDDAAARLRDLESRGNGFQTAGSARLPAELRIILKHDFRECFQPQIYVVIVSVHHSLEAKVQKTTTFFCGQKS